MANDYKDKKLCVYDGIKKAAEYKKQKYTSFRVECVLTDFN